jgi:uncharacterized protein involved in outer membrane biogenesis
MIRSMPKRFKISGTVVLVVLLLLALSPLFISLEQFRPEIEGKLTETLGQQVQLGELQVYLLPAPKLRIASLRVGDEQLVANKVDIYPRLLALLDKRIDIHHLNIKDLKLTQGFIDGLAQLGTKQGAEDEKGEVAIDFGLQRVSVDQLQVGLAGTKNLGPYELELSLDGELMPVIAWLQATDGSLRIDLKAEAEHYTLALQAGDWQVPLGPGWQFQRLAAVGKLDRNILDITSFSANLYKGRLSGTALLGWESDWNLIGNLESKSLQLEPFLAPLLDKPVIAGALTGKGAFSMRADSVAELGKRPGVQADFLIADGVIYNADLEKATDLLSNEAVKGGQTPFSKLSGQLAMQAGAISLRELEVKSDTLEATGKVNIAADETLHGEVEVGITKTGSLVSVPIKVAGTMNDPSLRPTDEALVGGAVGTGLFGPGVGTAIGVKAGSFFNNLFGGDSEGKPAKSGQAGQTDLWTNEDETD